MKYVEIYLLNDDGTQRVAATCALEGEVVVCKGDEALVANLERDGIFDYSLEERKRLFPKDGLKFLEQLSYHFKSGYINASEVKEK